MTKSRAHRTVVSAIPGVIAFTILLGGWELFVRVRDISPLVLPAPSAIAKNVATHFDAYMSDAVVTFREAALGFAGAFIVSAGLAVAMVHSRIARQAVEPIAVWLRCIPVVAFAPALALWLGFGYAPKIIVAALITFPPFIVSLVAGLRNVDQPMLDVLLSADASRTDILTKLRIPSATPFAFAAAKICVSLALIGAVVAEWAGSSEGLGYRIIRAQRDLETTTVWGAITVLAAMGLVATFVVVLIEQRALRWAPRR